MTWNFDGDMNETKSALQTAGMEKTGSVSGIRSQAGLGIWADPKGRFAG